MDSEGSPVLLRVPGLEPGLLEGSLAVGGGGHVGQESAGDGGITSGYSSLESGEGFDGALLDAFRRSFRGIRCDGIISTKEKFTFLGRRSIGVLEGVATAPCTGGC